MRRVLCLILSLMLLLPVCFAQAEDLTDIVQDGMVLGRCAAPSGYRIASQAACSMTDSGSAHPWLLNVSALAPDETVLLTYASARGYIAPGDVPDETFNSNFLTPVLPYMTASDYCDFLAQKLNSQVLSITPEEENTFPELQPFLRKREEGTLQAMNQLTAASYPGPSVRTDQVSITVAMRRYCLTDDDGSEYCFCIASATQGVWETVSLSGNAYVSESYLLWEAPFVYTLLCPADQWESSSNVFSAFVLGTSVSDQFMAANRRLSAELWSFLATKTTIAVTDYGTQVMREETDLGADYSEERLSDYMWNKTPPNMPFFP